MNSIIRNEGRLPAAATVTWPGNMAHWIMANEENLLATTAKERERCNFGGAMASGTK